MSSVGGYATRLASTALGRTLQDFSSWAHMLQHISNSRVSAERKPSVKPNAQKGENPHYQHVVLYSRCSCHGVLEASITTALDQ